MGTLGRDAALLPHSDPDSLTGVLSRLHRNGGGTSGGRNGFPLQGLPAAAVPDEAREGREPLLPRLRDRQGDLLRRERVADTVVGRTAFVDEKAIITATDFLPLGAEGTPEYGTPGLEAMTGSPGLRDLVSALSNKETIFALAEKELNPLQTVGEGEDATLQPTFGPLQGFVTDSDERFEMMFSGL